MSKPDPIALTLAILVSISAVAIGINNLTTLVRFLQSQSVERNAPPAQQF